MAQYKIYGERAHLARHRARLSDILHGCSTDFLKLPEDKRFHRFIPLDPEDFIRPADRTSAYTVIEISMFEGRAPETKKALLHAIMERVPAGLGIPVGDVEITIFETPMVNWGIRGKTGDELVLGYRVKLGAK
ncbi:tautomerase family protein [Nisaea sp.]|uniref:tautomerase family protein n=1 Tax=Nisaea sp. TaxID=2024842 RepID=UPI003B51A0F9